MTVGRCELCGRDDVGLTRHHLIPRARHNKPRTRRTFKVPELTGRLAMLCRPCHGFIHKVLTEAELASTFHSLDALRTHPDIARFVAWVSSKAPGLHVRSRKAHR